MDKYKVKVNPRAIRELDHIYEYIANEKRSAWIALRRVAIATRRKQRMSQATFFILISYLIFNYYLLRFHCVLFYTDYHI